MAPLCSNLLCLNLLIYELQPTSFLGWLFSIDALSVLPFSFISSCQAPSFLFCSKACHSHTFSLRASYPSVTSLFFPPNGKTNVCTKGFSLSSVLFSPFTFLISIRFFSHLERVSSDPRICPPQKSPLKSQPCMVLYPLLSVLSLVHQFVQRVVAPILENLRKAKISIKALLLLMDTPVVMTVSGRPTV